MRGCAVGEFRRLTDILHLHSLQDDKNDKWEWSKSVEGTFIVAKLATIADEHILKNNYLEPSGR